jgi:hypothetical protein
MWKCQPVESLEIQKQDFHPSHRPWKSLRDSHIPTCTTIPLIINPELRTLSEKCYPCPRIVLLPMFPAAQFRRYRVRADTQLPRVTPRFTPVLLRWGRRKGAESLQGDR